MNKKNIIVMLLVLALISTYALFFLYKPLMEYFDFHNEISGLEEANELSEREIKELTNQKELLDKNNQKITILKNKLKYDFEDGAFLIRFSQKLSEQNVELMGYSINDEEKFKFFTARPIDIELAGEYNSVLNVVNYLESQKNMTQVQEIEMSQGARDESNTIDSEKLVSETVLVERDPLAVLPGESLYEEVEVLRTLDAETEEKLFDGFVDAKISLVIYTINKPEDKLEAGDIESWKIGKDNPFSKD